jgi:hypothetical protein
VFISGSALPTNTAFLWAISFNGASSYYAINGALTPTTVNPGTAGLTGGMFLGGNNAALGFIGDIAEFVILSSTPSNDDRQKMEGYLAHKWGLDGNLPSGHPYKSAPPEL